MTRPIAIVGAPSSIGIRPYDDGTPRRLDLAPGALRAQGLVTRLDARDDGDVLPPPYRELVRPPLAIRNAADVADYSGALAERVAKAGSAGEFVLVLGGDCSIILGSLLGVSRSGPTGLVYADAHSDFATPDRSTTGSAAAMCLALAVGRGESPLARLGGPHPLVAGKDVALLGRRDHSGSFYYGQDELERFEILDLDHPAVRASGPAETARRILERVARPELRGFWIHLDADVLDPAVMPAVDSPEPGGMGLDEIADLLTPLARHPKALGMQLTIYDPKLDPDARGAMALTALLQRILRPASEAAG
jgi:arginase